MTNAEILIILLLGAIAYQLYQLLKIGNKKTETFASEEHSTLYPVFTPRQIQWAHDEAQQTQKHLEGGLKSVALEQEELLAFKRSGKPVEEFVPSKKLLATLKIESEHISEMHHHFAYKEKMIEANLAALNGTSITEARDEALKYSYLPMATLIEHFNKDLAHRRQHWKEIYDTVTGKELYATDDK